MGDLEKEKRKTHPIEKTNIVSLLTYGHTFGIFKKGFKKDLQEEDIYQVLKSCNSKKCGDRTEKQWRKTPSLIKLLLYQFGKQYLLVTLLNIVWSEVNSVLSPLGMSKVVAYFTPNQKKITQEQVYGYAGILVFLKVFHFWFSGNLRLWETILNVKIQTSLRSLLFRKALKISPAAHDTNLGNMVTLITKDISCLERNLWMVKDFIIFTIEFGTIAYLLYNKIGYPAFIGLGMVFAAVPIQVILSAKLKKIRLEVGKNSDERLQRMQETLSVMKIIKIYTWEQFFYKRISESRKREISSLVKVFMINTFINTLGVVVSKVSFVVLIMIYIWMGYTTNTELIFYILQLFNQVNTNFGITLPANFSRTAQFYAAVIRLDRVLHCRELEKAEGEGAEKRPAVFLKNVSFNLENKQILKRISLSVTKPGLTLITGSVGSGKSSLLKIILRDFQPVAEGQLEVQGSISYASQDPWIFPATIRQNILFGKEYDKNRYNEVIRVCALEYDFSLFDDGDQTVLTDRGQNLSKGQQARINLARAVYRDTDIYLLDDSLTALDPHVQDFIFTECLMKFLNNKIVILVSQNSSHMKKAYQVVTLDGGKMEDYDRDSLDRVTKEHIAESQPDNVVDDEENTTRKSYNPGEAKLLQTEQQQTKKDIYREVQKQGSVEMDVYKKYFGFGGGFVVFVLIMLVYVVAQFCDSYGDKLLTQWVDLQQEVLDLEGNSTHNGSTSYDDVVNEKDFTFTLVGILTVLRSVLSIAKFYALMWFCRTASINLHKKMTIALIGATMAFFDTHFIGNILNRLSYDLNNIDEFIPFLFPGLGNTIFQAGGSIVLIATINWFFLIPVVVFLVILALMRTFVIPTGRSLKRLEAATRSPLIGHINSSLEGLTTIRAFNAERDLKEEFDKHQDLFSSAFLTLRISMLGFSFYMDFISALFTIVVIARFLFFEHSSSAGNVGLALTQVFKLTTYVEITVKMWADVESAMTSVERALEYTKMKQETKEGKQIADWPSKGAVKFEKVTLCYEGCRTPVLKGITFDIKPKEKVGVVGRTGAGKSSLITVLYRLYEFDGSIEIDGVETKSVSLECLRKNISIIPQDPVLFTGTVRENIDPLNKYSDDEIWKVINKVGLKELIPSLETIIKDSGSSYSSGQKQLICLARAAMAQCTILVLDEATANMDAETDKMLHRVIEETFTNCTTITIAHRLHLVMDCDKVLVLDSGNVVEFDHPKILMNQNGSLFQKMCQESKMD